MPFDARIISIGALPAHPLWNERPANPARSGHATTTLIRSRDRTILIDPGLPAPAIAARLHERAGIAPDAVTHVFLTSFKPDARRGLEAFPSATWWISEREREGVGVPLIHHLRTMADHDDADDADLRRALERDAALLKRFEPAPDRLADRVDLFPLYGVTPGSCGVLVAGPVSGLPGTILVCGDAVPTIEHVERATILHAAADTDAARESLREALEIADTLILGRDNLILNPSRHTA